MGKGSEPKSPAPPDYAAANREGIYADIETLPIRRLLDYATRAGEKVEYAAPGAEKRYNDTIKAQTSWDAESASLTALSQAEGKTPAGYIAREKLQRLGSRPVVAREDMITADFTGKGDIDISRLQAKLRGETAGLEAANQLGIAQEYAPQFQQIAIDALKRQDPEGYAGRQDLARGLRSDYSSQDFPTEGAESRLLRQAAVGQSLRGGPTGSGYSALDALMRQAGISQAGLGQDNFAGSDATQQARNAALQRGLDDFALGSQLSGEQARQVEQSVRGAAAARGQALSAGGALQEIIGKYNVGEQLRQQRLSNLINIGSQAFAQEQSMAGSRAQQAQQRLQNLFGAQQAEYGQEQGMLANRQQQAQLGLANLFNAQSTQFGQEQAMRQETQQQQQRRLSNLQQYTLGAPISGQFQSLQGAQQSAAPYTPIMAQGIGQNANAGQQGAQFAGNIFGTESELFKSQVAQANAQSAGTGSLVGTGASLAIAL